MSRKSMRQGKVGCGSSARIDVAQESRQQDPKQQTDCCGAANRRSVPAGDSCTATNFGPIRSPRRHGRGSGMVTYLVVDTATSGGIKATMLNHGGVTCFVR